MFLLCKVLHDVKKMNPFQQFSFTLLFLINATGLFGQSTENPAEVKPRPINTTLFYNLNWELTTSDKSFFRREAYIDFTEMVFDGVYKDYNKENVLIAEGFYAHGVKGGLQNEYNSNRSLRSTIEYNGNDFTIWEFKGEQKGDSIKNGNGKFTVSYFYISGLVERPSWKQGVLRGEFRSGKRAGIWTYHDLNKIKTDEEVYENGKLVNRTHFTEATTIELNYKKDIVISLSSLISETIAFDHNAFEFLNEVFEQQPRYPVSFQRNITYPGGMKKLLLLLVQNADIPAGQVCIVKLRVDEHGRILKYAIAESVNPSVDERAVKAIKLHDHKFFPAIKNGLPYPSTIFIPVSGGQYWIDFLNSSTIEDILKMR